MFVFCCSCNHQKSILGGTPVAVGLLLIVALFGHCIRLYDGNKLSKREIINNIYLIEITLLVVSILAYSVNLGHNETWYRYFLSYTLAIAMFISFSKYSIHNKAMIFVGSISYDLYLLQEIIHRYMFNIIWPHINSLSIYAIVIFPLLTFGIMILLSAIVHFTIEHYGILCEKQLANSKSNSILGGGTKEFKNKSK